MTHEPTTLEPVRQRSLGLLDRYDHLGAEPIQQRHAISSMSSDITFPRLPTWERSLSDCGASLKSEVHCAITSNHRAREVLPRLSICPASLAIAKIAHSPDRADARYGKAPSDGPAAGRDAIATPARHVWAAPTAAIPIKVQASGRLPSGQWRCEPRGLKCYQAVGDDRQIPGNSTRGHRAGSNRQLITRQGPAEVRTHKEAAL